MNVAGVGGEETFRQANDLMDNVFRTHLSTLERSCSFHAMAWRISIRPLFGHRASIGRHHLSTTATLENVVERSDFLEIFMKDQRPSPSAVDYFSSFLWTRKFVEDEAYKAIPFFSRYLNERTGENRFFAETVNSNTTISHLLALQLQDLDSPGLISHSGRPLNSPPDLTTPHELICLMSLGKGLDSHPSIVHGGFQAVIFDEIMRNLILLHNNATSEPGPRDRHFTVNMNISYAAPVTTPGIFLVRSKLVRREGRTWFTKAEIVNSDDKILTSAESTWVTAKKH
ncbi:Thioesterase superfamily [Penicillium camemberti]|uniref:Thioesterase superfamily n=1 Tax=Penicillium camemberti (strain FM 013) TaxID=1429867 RepID=A0A0G4PMQ0_PENC3|nr:Thioesterase superfamily [Penicillium camemberti]